MTRGERMRALGCMCRAMVMRELAHGAGMQRRHAGGALVDAGAQQAKRQKTTASPPLRAWPPAMAAIMKRDAAARAPRNPGALFPFSSRAEHAAPDAVISPNRLTVKRTTDFQWAWARSEQGLGADCGVVRWALQLSKEWGNTFRVGVASDAFREYTEACPKQSWFFQDSCMYADGQQQGDKFRPPPFARGDVVALELERAPGVDGVLRVRVAGKTPRELRGLPRDGVLYLAVGLDNRWQSITMVAMPRECT